MVKLWLFVPVVTRIAVCNRSMIMHFSSLYPRVDGSPIEFEGNKKQIDKSASLFFHSPLFDEHSADCLGHYETIRNFEI